MEIFKANLQQFHNRLEVHWVSLVPTVFRRVFRSICVGFLPLEKSPDGFRFQVTLRVRFPKPPWNLFYTKILSVFDYCEPVSSTASGRTNRTLLTIHHVFNFTGFEPDVCLWVGHGVWTLQKPCCAKTERKEVQIRKKVMCKMIPTSFSTIDFVTVSRKLMEVDVSGPFGVLIPAGANAIALPSTVYIFWIVSGDHVNPAVAFAMVVAGRFSVPTAMFYWGSQMFASFMICLVLKVIIVEQHVPIYKFAGEMTGFGASVLEGVLVFALVYFVFTAALNILEVCLQNGQMRILALWLGSYEYKETKETLVANEQSFCIRRFNSHGLEPLHTTYNNFLLITVMRKAFRSFIYKMIAFYKYMKRGLNRFYLLPVRLLLESRVTSTSSSKLSFNFLYLVQWLYLNGSCIMSHVKLL